MPPGHLLLVPDGVTPSDVQALVLSRFPSEVLDDGGVRLSIDVLPGCMVEGPAPAPVADAHAWPQAYLLTAPEQRGAPVPEELRGRGGLLAAFADGEPTGHEREMVELGLAMARRLGGALRTSTGALLTPQARPDLLLYTDVWLHPDALLHVLAPHLPGVALHGDEQAGSPHAPPDAVTGTSLLTDEGERRWLHAEADAYDAAALAEPEVTDSYGVLAADPDGTIWSVAVEAAMGVPPALAGLLPAGTMLYELRCYPTDETDESAAVERLDAATAALLDVAGGYVVDDDGFLVNLASG
ncbi:hypothetical protein [Pseudactinotalea sp.]|uniref:hypothetical protein n=1 Tax=Pseudactinotalea sp. TaxID=1926260 RepID=UPI003B3BD1D1